MYKLKTKTIHYASKFGKLSSGHRTGKGQFSFNPFTFKVIIDKYDPVGICFAVLNLSL